MRTRTRQLTAAAVLVALTGTAGATIANADPTPGAGTPTDRPTASGKPADGAGGPTDRAGGKHRPLMARALHGSVTVGGE